MYTTLFQNEVDRICIFVLVGTSPKQDKCLIMNMVNNQVYCVIKPSSKNRTIIPLNATYKELFKEEPRIGDFKVFHF